MLDDVNKLWPNIRHRILKPFVIDIDPNLVTILALLVAFAAGVAISYHMLFTAAVLILLNGFLDILDGEIASKYGKSRRGDLLDHVCDRLADIAILMGIAGGGFVDVWMIMIAISLMLLVSYLGTEAQALLKKRLYAGILGRADRLVLVFLGLLAEIIWPGMLSFAVMVLIALSTLTFVQRFWAMWSALR